MSRSAAILGDCGWHESGIDDDDFRPVQPDALLDVAAADREVRVFVEYDRTRRVDKNYDKFLRYETLITVWWQATDLGCPFVVFVCQDADHRRRFIHAADVELTGHLSARTEAGHEEHYYARDRTLFVLESDIRNGEATAMRLPELPPRHEQRSNPATVRRVTLPGLQSWDQHRAVRACSLRRVPSWGSHPSGTPRRPADARNSPSRLCCTRKGGPPLRAGPPFLDLPDKSGQGSTGGKRSGRRRVGRVRGWNGVEGGTGAGRRCGRDEALGRGDGRR